MAPVAEARAGGRTTRRRGRARRGRPGGPRPTRLRPGSGRGSVRGAWSARCSDTQPSAPGSAAWPAQITSPEAVSSSSRTARSRAPEPGAPATPGRGGDGAAGELVDHLSTPSTPRGVQLAATCCQAAQEAAQGGRLDRLDLLAQPGQRATTQQAQHLGVAPLRARPGRPELAVEHPALGAEPLQGVADDGGAEPEPGRDVGGGERAVGAGEPGDQVGERVVDRLGEGVGGAGRDGHAEAVAQPADVLDRGPPLLAGHPDLDDPAGVRQRGQPLGGCSTPRRCGPRPPRW